MAGWFAPFCFYPDALEVAVVFHVLNQSLCRVSLLNVFRLFVGVNKNMGTEGWHALGAALSHLRNLKQLYLGEKGINCVHSRP